MYQSEATTQIGNEVDSDGTQVRLRSQESNLKCKEKVKFQMKTSRKFEIQFKTKLRLIWKPL